MCISPFSKEYEVIEFNNIYIIPEDNLFENVYDALENDDNFRALPMYEILRIAGVEHHYRIMIEQGMDVEAISLLNNDEIAELIEIGFTEQEAESLLFVSSFI